MIVIGGDDFHTKLFRKFANARHDRDLHIEAMIHNLEIIIITEKIEQTQGMIACHSEIFVK